MGEDDDGFLLVKNKRGMSESVLPYICSIRGAKPELRSGGFNRDAQHLYDTRTWQTEGYFRAHVKNCSSVYNFRV